MATQSIRISPSLFELVKQQAAKQSQTPDAFVERLLSKQLEPQHPASDQSQWNLAIAREQSLYETMHQQLKETHFGKYIAIYQGDLIGEGTDRWELKDKIRKQYGKVPILFTQVLEDPIQTIHMRSPKLL